MGAACAPHRSGTVCFAWFLNPAHGAFLKTDQTDVQVCSQKYRQAFGRYSGEKIAVHMHFAEPDPDIPAAGRLA